MGQMAVIPVMPDFAEVGPVCPYRATVSQVFHQKRQILLNSRRHQLNGF
jgi:hypothetical protein